MNNSFAGGFGSFGGGHGGGHGHGGGGHGLGHRGVGFLPWYDGYEEDAVVDVLDPEETGGLLAPVVVTRRRLGW